MRWWMLLVALVGCGRGEVDTSIECCFGGYADAGENQHVDLGDTVVLVGLASTCSGGEAAYSWSLEQTPVESTLDDDAFGRTNGTTEAVEVSFVPDVVGTYVASLTASDGMGVTAPDMVVIEVTSNLPPIASCGEDQRGVLGDPLHFDGTASYDPEGRGLAYAWGLAHVPEDSLLTTEDIHDRTTALPSIVPDTGGAFALHLVVSDGEDDSQRCYATGDVVTDAHRPHADAGLSGSIPPCATEHQLGGWGSWDPDGDALTFAWDIVEVPVGSAVSRDDLSDSTAPDPFFTWDLPGGYTFLLQVSDGLQESAPDVATWSVVDPATNRPPQADAGTDIAETVATTGDTCDPVVLSLDGTNSVDPDGDEAAFSWSTNSDLVIGSPSLAWTTASTPVIPLGVTRTWTVGLEVADCEYADFDEVAVEVHCGEAQ